MTLKETAAFETALEARTENTRQHTLFQLDVIEYLMGERDREENVWLRDDVNIAVRTCVHAMAGHAQPDVIATYECLGLHPKHLWEAVVERARAKTGGLYADFYDEQGNWRYEQTLADPAAVEQLIADRNKALALFPPKKPAHSISRKDYPCVHRKSASQSA